MIVPALSIRTMVAAPYLMYRKPPLSSMEKLVVTRLAAFVAFVADVAVVADPAVVAEVAVAALPEILIPQVPVAPEPPVEGTSSAVRAPPAEVEFVPPLAIGSVPVTCEVSETPESVPPRVSVPEEVTVPVSVIPLTLPVVPTDVTVPVFEVKPDGLLAA
jgi:hypothetical protein